VSDPVVGLAAALLILSVFGPLTSKGLGQQALATRVRGGGAGRSGFGGKTRMDAPQDSRRTDRAGTGTHVTRCAATGGVCGNFDFPAGIFEKNSISLN